MSKTLPLEREARRLAALASYDILDTPVEEAFDEVAQLASEICQTPIAVVNLIGQGRQFFKAEVGLGVRETPFESSFCARAILEEDFLLVPDATQDPRFDCNPLVTGEPGLRFYAGALLKTGEGLPIGTLCVLDVKPRNLSPLQQKTLRVLARQVMAQLDLRLALRQRADSEARRSAIVESAVDYAIIAADLTGQVTEWNSGAEQILGWSAQEMIGQPVETFFTPEDRAHGMVDHEMRDAVTHGRGTDERWHMRRNGQRFWASGEMMPLYENSVLTGYVKILRDRTPEKQRADQLTASEARLRASQQAGQIGTFEVDLATGVMSVTPQFCAIFGVETADSHVPATFENLVIPEDRHIPSNARTRGDAAALSEVEYRIRRAGDGDLRWIGRRAEFLCDDEGGPLRMVGTVQDITRRKRAERKVAALLDLGDRLRDAGDLATVIAAASQVLGETLDVARAGYALIDPVGGAFDVEHAWAAPGVSPMTGRHDLAHFDATARALATGSMLAIDDIEQAVDLTDDLRSYQAMGTRAQIMVPLLRKGELVGVLFAHARNPRGWTDTERNFARNLADRTYAAVAKVQAEAHQALLNQELSHRLKNTLAMVQAIATQTLKPVTQRDAVQTLMSRLLALSTAHDILLQDDWQAVRLDQVAQGVLALHAGDRQIALDGPPVKLAPRAGLAVSLLLHELATNAIKHGALSQPGGRVSLDWRIEAGDAGETLLLAWVESGGPSVAPPSRRGFGSRLIQMGLVGAGHSDIAYPPTGLVARFSAPLQNLLDEGL